jgi:hypothetical protein
MITFVAKLKWQRNLVWYLYVNFVCDGLVKAVKATKNCKF